jgi:hypothetical protein
MLNQKIVTIAAISSVLALGTMMTVRASEWSETRIPKPSKKAMTWTLYQTSGSSALFARDEVTNAYTGDTLITERRSLLCVSKAANLAKPKNLKTGESISPGGASVLTWSGRQAFAIPNVLGSSLTSEAVADGKCASVGKVIYGHSRWRMAEHHDGTGPNPGWSFWAQAYGGIQGMDRLRTVRYWVKINDQPANPW